MAISSRFSATRDHANDNIAIDLHIIDRCVHSERSSWYVMSTASTLLAKKQAISFTMRKPKKLKLKQFFDDIYFPFFNEEGSLLNEKSKQN